MKNGVIIEAFIMSKLNMSLRLKINNKMPENFGEQSREDKRINVVSLSEGTVPSTIC
ncbi:hypothetical protein [Candidatus Arsenophonus triatominarum]|uniref:hypothetical protein n=1 Tax=Candidatus Arsenophonus triatominarum TaxID=57911 RepID=UPI00164F3445|nr:hypothetical protein [Candidatus Arsenophonus triatominarum]